MIYDERKPYSFSSQGNPNRQRGTPRMRGPALAKKVRCPNNPRSMRLDPSTRPTLACSPGECACSTTLTLTLADEIRTRQRTLYGTTAWNADYGRRSGVESANASLKWHHSLLHRGSIRLKGTTRNAIAVALILAANNVQVLIRAYGWDVGNPSRPPQDVTALPSPIRALHRQRASGGRRKRKPRPPPPSEEVSNGWLPAGADNLN